MEQVIIKIVEDPETSESERLLLAKLQRPENSYFYFENQRKHQDLVKKLENKQMTLKDLKFRILSDFNIQPTKSSQKEEEEEEEPEAPCNLYSRRFLVRLSRAICSLFGISPSSLIKWEKFLCFFEDSFAESFRLYLFDMLVILFITYALRIPPFSHYFSWLLPD